MRPLGFPTYRQIQMQHRYCKYRDGEDGGYVAAVVDGGGEDVHYVVDCGEGGRGELLLEQYGIEEEWSKD